MQPTAEISFQHFSFYCLLWSIGYQTMCVWNGRRLRRKCRRGVGTWFHFHHKADADQLSVREATSPKNSSQQSRRLSESSSLASRDGEILAQFSDGQEGSSIVGILNSQSPSQENWRPLGISTAGPQPGQTQESRDQRSCEERIWYIGYQTMGPSASRCPSSAAR